MTYHSRSVKPHRVSFLLLLWLCGITLVSACQAPTGSREQRTPINVEAQGAVPPSLSSATYRGNLQRTGLFDTQGVLQAPEIIWKFKTEEAVRSTPIVAGELVYFGSDDRNFYAVDITTGTEEWRVETPGQQGPHGLYGEIGTSATISDDIVYFTGADSYLYAVDALTGTVYWKIDLDGNAWSSPAQLDSVLFVGSRGGLYAFNVTPITGTIKWAFPTALEPPQGNVVTAPAASEGTLYFGASNGIFYAVDIATGDLNWKFGTGSPSSIYTTSAIGEGLVFFGGGTDDDEHFYAVDIKSGQEVWRYKVTTATTYATAVAGGLVFVVNGDFDRQKRIVTPKYLHALDTKTGQEKWRFDAQEYLSTAASIAEDIVYFGADEYLYAVDIDKGTVKWKLEVPGISSDITIANGVLYFGTADGYVYAVR